MTSPTGDNLCQYVPVGSETFDGAYTQALDYAREQCTPCVLVFNGVTAVVDPRIDEEGMVWDAVAYGSTRRPSFCVQGGSYEPITLPDPADIAKLLRDQHVPKLVAAVTFALEAARWPDLKVATLPDGNGVEVGGICIEMEVVTTSLQDNLKMLPRLPKQPLVPFLGWIISMGVTVPGVWRYPDGSGQPDDVDVIELAAVPLLQASEAATAAVTHALRLVIDGAFVRQAEDAMHLDIQETERLARESGAA